MDPTIFLPGFPGVFVPTTGWDLKVRDGTPERIPVSGKAFVPNPLPPRIDHALVPDLDRRAFIGRVSEELLTAQANLARLDGVASSLPNPDLLLRPFRLREAKLSSKIENTFASVEELALAHMDHNPERDEVREVWNYLEALDHGLDSDLPLCNKLFRELHALLLKDVRGDDKRPGEFRTIQVCIGDESGGFAGARFVPPPPGDALQRCLSDFEKFLNPHSYGDLPVPDRFPRLIEIAMAHYQFESIHPFSDGNGRLGRLIVSIALCRNELITRPLVYVSAFLDQHRSRYYDLLLRVSTHNDWESWVKFFLTAVSTQADDAVRRAERLRTLRQKYIDRVTAKRTSALAIKIVDLLFMEPAVRPTLLAKRLRITVQAAQKHVNRLVEKKILEEVTGGTYGRRYLARGILRAVEDEN